MLGRIFQTFANCFKIPELRSRIIFTLLLLAGASLVRLIPIPGLDGAALQRHFDEVARKSSGPGGILGLYSLFTGGGLERCSVGALSIFPYISATIIIQLLTAVVPALGKLAREEGGRPKIIAYGRYLTVLLCLGQGTFMALGWENPREAFDFGQNIVLIENAWVYRFQTVIILTTGTLLLMWLGEQITERGVGNGVSLIITIGILSRLPLALKSFKTMFFPADASTRQFNWTHMVMLVILLAVVIAGVILVTQGQRKIPVQYAQRAVGRKVYSGGTSFMPLRVNYAGVMPVIFAQAILMFIGLFMSKMGEVLKLRMFVELGSMFGRESGWLYIGIYSLMILFFSYFWVATQFNELQVADDLKKHGGYIPGVRPGVATSEFLHKTMSRVTFAGALALVLIAIVPILLNRVMKMEYSVASFFGGTSLLISVGVLLDTMRTMESHLLMRHYDGFLQKGKVRGRS